MKPKSISLFSGAGGMDIGVGKAGFDNVCSIEMDPHCASTLRRNSARTAIWQVDVRALDPQRTVDALGLTVGDVALLHGGPPCQPFSQIGHKRGLLDPRGRLAFEMVRFAEVLRPAAIMLEQVPKFLDAQAADGMTVLDVMSDSFLSIGYETHASILNALDYGVPQSRNVRLLSPCRLDNLSLSLSQKEILNP
ncbi:MAG: DNA cytosine methyltransferase [Paracoccaceae bacterium]|nr:DNA cytosine methyltransferase [Paracoccaceae bacterium]